MTSPNTKHPSDEQILEAATKLYPRWREDIQEKFVLTVVRAALASRGAPQPATDGDAS